MGWKALLLGLFFLPGCESLNEAFVRQMFTDHGVSQKVGDQIREGLERRQKLPQPGAPREPAPAFLDQG